jgi:serine/threonine protein kinase
MLVQVVCPNPKCRKRLSVGDDHSGKLLNRPTCGVAFRVAPTAGGESRRSTVGPAAGSLSGSDPASGAAPSQPRARGPAPASIGQFKVECEVGHGAFGVVYKARDPKLNRDVAIKVLYGDALGSKTAFARFLREAQVVAQMHHSNIVPVFELGERDGVNFIVSKFIDGQVLSEVIPENGVDPDRAADLTIQLLEALAFAHDINVLHRDVKPSNVILDGKGRLHLTDFGLAGLIGRETGRMTQEGAKLGTPAYMAPEQADGDIRRVGPAADQYAAGVVLYELLTGHLPFEGAPIQVILYNIINTPILPLSAWRPGLDPALEAICTKATAKRPEDRYPSCSALADALRAWRTRSADTPVIAGPTVDVEPVQLPRVDVQRVDRVAALRHQGRPTAPPVPPNTKRDAGLGKPRMPADKNRKGTRPPPLQRKDMDDAGRSLPFLLLRRLRDSSQLGKVSLALFACYILMIGIFILYAVSEVRVSNAVAAVVLFGGFLAPAIGLVLAGIAVFRRGPEGRLRPRTWLGKASLACIGAHVALLGVVLLTAYVTSQHERPGLVAGLYLGNSALLLIGLVLGAVSVFRQPTRPWSALCGLVLNGFLVFIYYMMFSSFLVGCCSN